MDNAKRFVIHAFLAVSIVEPHTGPTDRIQCEINRKFLPRTHELNGLQTLTPHILHGKVVRFVRFSKIEDLDNIFMSQPGRDLSFIDEHGDKVSIPREVWQDSFDGEHLFKSLNPHPSSGSKKLGHSSAGDFFCQIVLAVFLNGRRIRIPRSHQSNPFQPLKRPFSVFRSIGSLFGANRLEMNGLCFLLGGPAGLLGWPCFFEHPLNV